MLRSAEDKAPVPQNKFMGDIEELAASYERKLIEVSAVCFDFPVGKKNYCTWEGCECITFFKLLPTIFKGTVQQFGK